MRHRPTKGVTNTNALPDGCEGNLFSSHRATNAIASPTSTPTTVARANCMAAFAGENAPVIAAATATS